jgi:hypothetical protein
MNKYNYLKSRAKRSYKRSLPPKEKRKEELEVLKSQSVEKEIVEVEDKEVIEISDDTMEEESKEEKYVIVILLIKK